MSDRRMDRRAFLGALAAAGAGAAGLPGRARGFGGRPAIQPVGLQLYTLRSLMQDDLPGTLSAVADIGYREVEFAGLYGTAPAAMRSMLDDLGLSAISSHVSLPEVRSSLPALLDDAATLGQSHLVVPSLPRDEMTPEGLRRIADDFNRAGETARDRGIRFGFHNHSAEFQPVEGVVPYDLLLERCDAELVGMQMDIYWIVDGGADPFAYFDAYPGRFMSVHAKDRTAGGEMVAVGEGVIDFQAIFARREAAGIEHIFVEHDRPEDPLASVRASYEYLSGL